MNEINDDVMCSADREIITSIEATLITARELRRPKMRFNCGARSALKLKEKDYLRRMLSRRQLQGFVRRAAVTLVGEQCPSE